MRFYHGGAKAVDPAKFYPEFIAGEDNERITSEKERIHREVEAHHPLTAPNRKQVVAQGDKIMVKRPAMFCPRDPKTHDPIEQLDEWIPGSISLSLVGHGYWIVPPGGWVDLDASISPQTVKAQAPHLLTEAEYAAQKARAEKQQQPQKQDRK